MHNAHMCGLVSVRKAIIIFFLCMLALEAGTLKHVCHQQNLCTLLTEVHS